MARKPNQLTVQAGPASARVVKAGRGKPLVYLSGAFGYRGWNPFLDELASRFTVYVPVHPGFGDTDGIDQIDDILDLTLYYFDLLDGLGLKAPHIVGHYFGAMIGAEMAALCSHRVSKLVLASPAGLWLEKNPGVDYFITPVAKLPGVLFNNSDSEIARATFPEAANDEERLQQGIERVRSLSTVAKFLWPLPDKGLKKRLHRIKSPTLIVVGQNDQIVPPQYGDEMAERIPGAKVEVIPNAGHLLMLERPGELAGLVTRFLLE